MDKYPERRVLSKPTPERSLSGIAALVIEVETLRASDPSDVAGQTQLDEFYAEREANRRLLEQGERAAFRIATNW